MDLLQNLLDQPEWPEVSAFLLGLMTALSPCPLATNITAIGYIGRELQDRRRVLLNGLLYTLGRTTTYTVLGLGREATRSAADRGRPRAAGHHPFAH